MYTRKSKAERRRWWLSRTEEERQTYIQHKQAEKAEKRQGKPSACPIFPVIDSSNRKEWQDKILKLNLWLNPGVIE